jgi:hypothetical protein
MSCSFDCEHCRNTIGLIRSEEAKKREARIENEVKVIVFSLQMKMEAEVCEHDTGTGVSMRDIMDEVINRVSARIGDSYELYTFINTYKYSHAEEGKSTMTMRWFGIKSNKK